MTAKDEISKALIRKSASDHEGYAPPEHGEAAQYWATGWNDCYDAINKPVAELLAELSSLTKSNGELREVVAYAVDNPEFDSAKFDQMARAVLSGMEES